MKGVPREQKMLKGHLPRFIYHRVNSNVRSQPSLERAWSWEHIATSSEDAAKRNTVAAPLVGRSFAALDCVGEKKMA